MDDKQDQAQDAGFRGFDTPGDDKLISNSSADVGSPSVTSRQRMEAPAAQIGGDVNETPGDSNPALDETLGFEKGQTDTASLLRARESAEEQISRTAGAELYADQEDTRRGLVDVSASSDVDEEIYSEREFNEPDEESELDILDVRGPNLPPDNDNER